MEIFKNLLKDENSVSFISHSGSISTAYLVSTQDNCTSSPEMLIEDLEKEIKVPVTNKILKNYLCWDTLFTLSKKVLMETEIRALEVWERATG